MIIALVAVGVTCLVLGWLVRGLYVRQMWRMERRFRRAAMGSSMKGGDRLD